MEHDVLLSRLRTTCCKYNLGYNMRDFYTNEVAIVWEKANGKRERSVLRQSQFLLRNSFVRRLAYYACVLVSGGYTWCVFPCKALLTVLL